MQRMMTQTQAVIRLLQAVITALRSTLVKTRANSSPRAFMTRLPWAVCPSAPATIISYKRGRPLKLSALSNLTSMTTIFTGRPSRFQIFHRTTSRRQSTRTRASKPRSQQRLRRLSTLRPSLRRSALAGLTLKGSTRTSCRCFSKYIRANTSPSTSSKLT
jgi:hypothetical protein